MSTHPVIDVRDLTYTYRKTAAPAVASLRRDLMLRYRYKLIAVSLWVIVFFGGTPLAGASMLQHDPRR